MTDILMPALSPTMEEGKLAKWLVKEGQTIKAGDIIAEIETDKATMEVEAVDEGTIAKIVVPEGTQDVAVNDVIAVLARQDALIEAEVDDALRTALEFFAAEPDLARLCLIEPVSAADFIRFLLRWQRVAPT